ncbi:unnamed protein product [Adineta steineri]|uniref:PARP catalytic domain-containing protein n=1 Tax=Adineta steineri TaxID=433720 RepID=A0A815IS77_9BILA|nr:unnamed protein product [Adineta steineri]CAF4093558.1 unnamed protein product [Adineta steineri]
MNKNNEGYEYGSRQLNQNKKHSFATDFIHDYLQLDDSMFSHRDDCYYLNNHCHIEERGGHRYLRPSHCSKFVLKQGKHLFHDYTWSYSYHGTSPKNVDSIVKYGLKIPGNSAGNVKINVANGSAFGNGIYSAKIPLYSQLYAPPVQWQGKYVQTIFMLRKDAKRTNITDIEGCYTQSMLGRSDIHKLYDGKIANHEIQWMTVDESAVVLHALLIKVHDSNPMAEGGEYEIVGKILDEKLAKITV